MKYSRFNALAGFAAKQRGITTLLIAILLLAILSVVAFFATSVGVFEQRTETNENRAKIAQTAAESALNLGIEFMRAHNDVVSLEDTGGWLEAGTLRWERCSTAAPSGVTDPCLAERDSVRRAQMYRYNFGGSTNLDVNAIIPTAAQPINVSLGGTATTPVTTTVGATLCRLDETDPTNTACVLEPEQPGLVAVTLVSNATIPGENAAFEVKETIATFRTIGGAAKVPLVASGSVKGLGSATIVANPNAGGWGVPASIWSPCAIDISGTDDDLGDPDCDPPGGGVGSVDTCHLGEFLDGRPREDLLTVCPFSNNACGCPNKTGLSTGAPGQREGIDILDIDGNQNGQPDITYFPRDPYDDPADPLDDSMFEVIFARDVVVEGTIDVSQACDGDCAIAALEAMGAEEVGCDELDASTSSGLYWARESGGCDLSGQIGSPEQPVVLVIEGNDGLGATKIVRINANTVIFGMLFIRSSNGTAELKATGSPQIYGMAVVEGTVDMGGSPTIVYSEEIAQTIMNSPAFNNFGRLPGSWLDSSTSF